MVIRALDDILFDTNYTKKVHSINTTPDIPLITFED